MRDDDKAKRIRITKITIRKTETEIVSRRIAATAHDVEINENDTINLLPTLTEDFGRSLLNGEVNTETKEK